MFPPLFRKLLLAFYSLWYGQKVHIFLHKRAAKPKSLDSTIPRCILSEKTHQGCNTPQIFLTILRVRFGLSVMYGCLATSPSLISLKEYPNVL